MAQEIFDTGEFISEYKLNYYQKLQIFENGLMITKHQSSTFFQWDDITSTRWVSAPGSWKNNIYYWIATKKKAYEIRVNRKDMSYFTNVDSLHYEKKVHGFLEKLAQGQDIKFGEIKVTPSGITFRDEILVWEKLSLVTPFRDSKPHSELQLEIYQNQEPRLWKIISDSRVKNSTLFLFLIIDIKNLELWKNNWDYEQAQIARNKQAIQRQEKSDKRFIGTFNGKYNFREETIGSIAVLGGGVLMPIGLFICMFTRILQGKESVTTDNVFILSILLVISFLTIMAMRKVNRDFKKRVKSVDLYTTELHITQFDKLTILKWADISMIWKSFVMGNSGEIVSYPIVIETLDGEVFTFDKQYIGNELPILIEDMVNENLLARAIRTITAGGQLECLPYTVNAHGIYDDENTLAWAELKKTEKYPEWLRYNSLLPNFRLLESLVAYYLDKTPD